MATLKSREILKARQTQASTENIKTQDPNTWQRMALKHRRTIQHSDWKDALQNPLGIGGGIITNSLQTVTSGEALQGTPLEGISLSSGTLKYTRFWRMKLLLNHNNMEKSEYSPRPTLAGVVSDLLPMKSTQKDDGVNQHTTKTLSKSEKESPDAQKIEARRSQRDSFIPAGKNYIEERFKALEGISRARQNDIFIINTSVSPYIAIKLQNRPDEIRFDGKSNWAAVASMGRNNPFMMYTGGEDSFTIDVSWFANDPAHREEVIYKCKLLDSWTKANGYLAAPPVLRIDWGTSGLFDNEMYILESAHYTLTHFQDRAMRPGQQDYYKRDIQDLKLYPNCATQTLVFKKVIPTNTTHEDLVPSVKLEGIQGINTNYVSA